MIKTYPTGHNLQLVEALHEHMDAVVTAAARHVASLPGADGPHLLGCHCQDCQCLHALERWYEEMYALLGEARRAPAEDSQPGGKRT